MLSILRNRHHLPRLFLLRHRAVASSASATNSLLQRDANGLPAFSRFDAADVVPAVTDLLHRQQESVRALEAELESESHTPSFSSTLGRLEAVTDALDLAWGQVQHLEGVANTAELREAKAAMQPKVVEASTALAQSKPIHAAMQAIVADDRAWAASSLAQRRIVKAALRAAELGGVGLDGEEKEAFNATQQAMSECSTTFSNTLLDATKAFSLTITEPSRVAGFPPTLKALAAAAAKQGGDADDATAEAGPWRLTLDAPCLVPVLQHAEDRELRERMYKANIKKASASADGGEGEDNNPVLQKILGLRRRRAAQLGRAAFADVSLSEKMADDVDDVVSLLEELRERALPAAEKELAELSTWAEERGASLPLAHWDVAFWAERQREELFGFSDEELRPYFPLDRVLDGVFGLVNDLFGITIKPVETTTAASPSDGDGGGGGGDGEKVVSVWHKDVRYFDVFDAEDSSSSSSSSSSNGVPIAGFYFDPYSRPESKRGGAWMGECRGRSTNAALCLPTPRGTDTRSMSAQDISAARVRVPVAYLVCNQGAPTEEGKPSLMSLREVETLLHELGHGLQHMLTKVDEGGAAGIRGVEWDAVELPSQLMEGFVYHHATLRSLSSHVETGEPIPRALFDKILDARKHHAAMGMMRQLYFSRLDLDLHCLEADPAAPDVSASEVEAIRKRVSERYALMPPLPEDAFLCSFAHIFAGGYACGYYSYKWAEVLAADAFAAFEEAGLSNDDADDASGSIGDEVAATGKKFRDTVLALGGSKHPSRVFEDFRGRAPTTEALLKMYGI